MLGPGYQLWEDTNRHRLAARLAAAVKRGEVEVAQQWQETRHGCAYVVVKVICEPRSRVPWYVGATVLALSAAMGIGVALYESRWIWFTLAGLFGVYWLLTRFKHSGACPGLHCPGCRG
jgi:hypothetical protein